MIKRAVIIVLLVVIVLAVLAQSGQGGFLAAWWSDVMGHGGSAVASAIPKPVLPTIAPETEKPHDVKAPGTPGPLPSDPPTDAATVVADLNSIEPTTSGPESPYSAAAFGPALTSHPAAVCDTADLALARGLRDVVYGDAPTNCVVAGGVLVDPYTGSQRTVSGEHLAQATVDPVVSPRWAWENGAASWSQALRQQFANDLGNLRVVAADTARDRDGRSFAVWSIDDSARRCTAVTRFVEVVAHYRLTMPQAEKATLSRDLAGCA